MTIDYLGTIFYNTLGGAAVTLACLGQGASWWVLAIVCFASQFYPALVIQEVFDESSTPDEKDPEP